MENARLHDDENQQQPSQGLQQIRKNDSVHFLMNAEKLNKKSMNLIYYCHNFYNIKKFLKNSQGICNLETSKFFFIYISTFRFLLNRRKSNTKFGHCVNEYKAASQIISEIALSFQLCSLVYQDFFSI